MPVFNQGSLSLKQVAFPYCLIAHQGKEGLFFPDPGSGLSAAQDLGPSYPSDLFCHYSPSYSFHLVPLLFFQSTACHNPRGPLHMLFPPMQNTLPHFAHGSLFQVNTQCYLLRVGFPTSLLQSHHLLTPIPSSLIPSPPLI